MIFEKKNHILINLIIYANRNVVFYSLILQQKTKTFIITMNISRRKFFFSLSTNQEKNRNDEKITYFEFEMTALI